MAPPPPPRIEPKEIETYWNIFSDRTGGGRFLTGEQAAPVLKNSGLREEQLARVWDLADIDNDGNLDFEEFCVAMRIIFDIINKEYADVPSTLPDWLVPESKAHLVQATRALSGRQLRISRPAAADADDDDDDDDDNDGPGLKGGFDWYMAPADKAKYESIYQENRDMRGEISFAALTDLYHTLQVPDTDIRSGWNLVNPSAGSTINKDATLAFLHILNNRHNGYRIPRTVPATLRSSFERGRIDYSVENQRVAGTAGSRWATRPDEETGTGRKTKFGEQYLTRLGRGAFKSTGTDFSADPAAESDAEWEEVRLRRRLQELDEKMARVEAEAERRRGGRRESRPALVRRELEQLLEYKRAQLSELEGGGGPGGGRVSSLKGIRDDLESVREQVDGLDAHLRTRQAELDRLRREVEEERRG